MKKICIIVLLLGSCLSGGSDFKSNGLMLRLLGLIESFGTANGTSSIPPSNLRYTGSPFIFTQNVAITTQTPTYTGAVTNCSISPSLPTGLVLNSATCAISGTPTVTQAAISYTIIASNSLGNTIAIISIEVIVSKYVSMLKGLLKTGQTTSYLNGDDGSYQKGVSRVFTTGGINGLLWQRCSAGQNNDDSCSGTAQTYTWVQANNYCNTLNLEGKTWRLPTVLEIGNIYDYEKSSGPKLNSNVFPNTQSNSFWSSTTVQHSLNPNTSCLVNFSAGSAGVGFGVKTSSFYVRCITEASMPLSNYTDNGNGTVTDSINGLIWQKCTAGLGTTLGDCSTGNLNSFTWSNAINYCEGLTLGGRSDWRLPNINELGSLIDYTKASNPTIDSTAFPNIPASDIYWSSTTNVNNTNTLWVVTFRGGGSSMIGTANKNSSPVYLRCVTGL
jgi:hypothetical protein